MNILGLIPARGGSKGVAGKNIKPLKGRPLLYYTAVAALGASKIDKLMLSSDDDAIIQLALSYGIEVPFVRPAGLSADDTPTLPVVQHALQYWMDKGVYYDAVCLLQVTSPLRTPDFIDAAIDQFIDSDADSLISVRRVPDEYNPHWVFEKKGDWQLATGDEKIISRRQDLPPAYIRDGALYITKTTVLMEQQSLYGKKINCYEREEKFYLNIDTAEDWIQAEKNINLIQWDETICSDTKFK